jgi:hypothetical protein
MPTEDEANLLRAHVESNGVDGLSTADEFLWRMLHVPRVRPRLQAYAVSATCEAGCASMDDTVHARSTPSMHFPH